MIATLPAVLLAAVIAGVQVQGNAVASDEEVVRLAGVRVGDPFDESTLAAVGQRLRVSGRFREVEVFKRFASISDPTQILLLIIVDEGPLRIVQDRDGNVRTVRRRTPWMFLPVLSAEDGYGLTYGGQFALPRVMGDHSRLAFPLTWGGDKRAAAELQKDFTRGPLSRITAGVAIQRRRNPFFDEEDDRRRFSVRGERQAAGHLLVGAAAGVERVSFAGVEDRFRRLGADIVYDTRLDPMLARNAVFGRAAVERLDFRGSGAVTRREYEGRGYVGLPGQSIVVVRALREDSNHPLPPYLQPLAGGMANLRGFKAGAAVGDTLVGGSIELRTPLTSPLNVGKMGLSVFMDAATAYGHDARLRDQRFERGIGGGIWFSAAFLWLNVAVAHGVGASTRLHVGSTLTF